MRRRSLWFLIYAVAVLFCLPAAAYFASQMADDSPGMVRQEVNMTETTQEALSQAELEKEQTKEEKTISVPEEQELEEYLVGVVAAEMPASFEMEALKAQAVAARTYAVYQMDTQGISLSQVQEAGGQAYISEDQRRERWQEKFEQYEKKIRTAVESTAGEILVYDQEPILAAFHAISAGATEDAENLWSGEDLPYLQSVPSPMDTTSTEYVYTVSLTEEETAALLQQADPELILAEGSLIDQMQVLSRSDAGYIEQMQIGNRTYTGAQVRTALGLRSADFTVEEKDGVFIFTSYGYGHGGGMSQYGANALALDGMTYQDILAYYYTDIQFAQIK